MNRFQKIATQCARDDIKRGWDIESFKYYKKEYLKEFKNRKFTFEATIKFKNFSKKWGI